MRYEGTFRRRSRQLRRFATGFTTPATRHGGVIVPTFWWDGHPNFGDDLTPWLLPRYGVVPLYSEPRQARVIGVGSLLEFLAPEHTGVVWGSGLMEDHVHRLPHVTALAVRGPLTAERIGLTDEPAYGDPGILVARHLPRPRPSGRPVLVPHGHHRATPALARMIQQAGDALRVVNVHQRAAPALRQIAAGSVVLTTSLHGLVTADAFGIPAVWTTLEPALDGGDFKFRDYEAAVTPGRTRFRAFTDGATFDELTADAWAADPARIAQLGDTLEASLARLASLDVGQLPFPQGIARAARRR